MKVTITQTTGVVLSLGFGGAGAPALLATAPVESAPAAGDLALVDRAGALVKVPSLMFVANLATISASFAVPEHSNALSIGPLTLAPGAVLTVPATSTYRVI
jgi:hypothetical protein